jgi:hypothetical protein
MNLAVLGLGGGEMLLLLVFLVPIALVSMAFWIWMLVSAIQNKNLSDNERICWVLAIIFLHIIGALLYLIIGRNKQPGVA